MVGTQAKRLQYKHIEVRFQSVNQIEILVFGTPKRKHYVKILILRSSRVTMMLETIEDYKSNFHLLFQY